MAHKYSSKTLYAMVLFIENHFTRSNMEALFLSVNVTPNSDNPPNKEQRATQVLYDLTHSEGTLDGLDELFKEIISRRRDLLEPSVWYNQTPTFDESTQRLLQSLRADGYEVRDGKIIALEHLEKEVTQEINLLNERFNQFGMQTASNHLDQAHQNFIEGNPESCNAMLRSALESTLEHVAVYYAGTRDNIPHRNPRYLSPVDVRDYLKNKGFLVNDEHKFISTFYGYASSNGSHPGISNEAESRLRRLMIVAIIQYCLEKFTLIYIV